jgi:hypothetical protein
MKVDAPPGFDVERIVVTYVKQQSEPTPPSPKPKPKPKTTFEYDEWGNKKTTKPKTKIVAKPKPKVVLSTPLKKPEPKLDIPLNPNRQIGGKCEMCWKDSAFNHDLCHRCQVRIRARMMT